ncbi:hypothetical protein [Vibrio sinaloensis]|uniref:hypothetical protein n=1 Tax=Photobacterium sp. (strain ATCC 43367) TaxID=379097 RepID=UPI00204D229D|nr:hypothetical protein [Vibrio sinaloensis]UPQ88120.1 hypothetical protein MTO69_00720 [Vibrio sinaloensis]
MSIKRAFFWTSAQTFTKVVSGIIIGKIVAISLGPVGLAYIGQYQNYSGLFYSFANGSVQTGIVSMVARDLGEKNQMLTRTNSVFILSVLSFLIGLALFPLSDTVSYFLFKSYEYTGSIKLLSFSLLFNSMNLYALSVLNGLGKVKEYSVANITLNVITTIGVSTSALLYGVIGALYSYSAIQIIFSLWLFYYVYNSTEYPILKIESKSVNKKYIFDLLSYGVVTISSGFFTFFILAGSRYVIIDGMGEFSAGIWEGASKIGLYFGMLFTLPISIYYLPKFASLTSSMELGIHFKKIFSLCLPSLALITLIMILSQKLTIDILFSQDFYEIKDILYLVLIAECLRVLTSVFTTFLFARKILVEIIFNQAVWSVSCVFLAYFLVDVYNLEGVAFAYLLACALQFFLIIYSFKRKVSSVF